MVNEDAVRIVGADDHVVVAVGVDVARRRDGRDGSRVAAAAASQFGVAHLLDAARASIKYEGAGEPERRDDDVGVAVGVDVTRADAAFTERRLAGGHGNHLRLKYA